MHSGNKLRIGIIESSRIGINRQLIGLGEGLNNNRELIIIGDDCSNLNENLDIVIGGYGSIEKMMFIKKKYPNIFTISITGAKRKESEVDLLISPMHMSRNSKNEIVIPGAIHNIKTEDIDEQNEDEDVISIFNNLKKQKTIGVLIGGSANNPKNLGMQMSIDFIKDFCSQLKFIKEQENANLLITSSRRTPKVCEDYLYNFFSAEENSWLFGPNDKVNPYKALLKKADFIIATNDSVSMASEVLSFGKPLFVANWTKDTSPVFNELRDRGLIRFLGVDSFSSYHYKPLFLSKEVSDKTMPIYLKFKKDKVDIKYEI